jgi:hypothetical protein
MNIFDFIKDAGNYPQRNVDRFEDGHGLIVDTARVSDGVLPFETAVSHPSYVDRGKWVIVEAYATRDESRVGHAQWVAKMQGPLPDKLVDCANSAICDILKRMGDKLEFPRR